MNLLALIAILSAPTASAADIIGSTIPPYPDGLAHQQVACIAGSALGFERICDYSVGVLGDAQGKPEMIFGARKSGKSATGKTPWKVTDAMPYPSLPEGYSMIIASCTDDGEMDETVIAAVQVADTEWHENVLWARRYDIESEKFVEHPRANVRCLNEGWGL